MRSVPNEAGPGCTTERWTTNNTDVLEVRYPWHPWYGRQVRVRAVHTRNGPPVVRCTILGEPPFPVQEIPRWMFEPEAGATGEVADDARVELVMGDVRPEATSHNRGKSGDPTVVAFIH